MLESDAGFYGGRGVVGGGSGWRGGSPMSRRLDLRLRMTEATVGVVVNDGGGGGALCV